MSRLLARPTGNSSALLHGRLAVAPPLLEMNHHFLKSPSPS